MARTVAQVQAQLDKVNTAIDDLLTTGQTYSRPDFSLGRASLADLMKMQQRLEKQLVRMGSTGSSSVVDSSGGTAGQTEDDEWGDD